MKVIAIALILILPFIFSYIAVVLYVGKYIREMKDKNEALYNDNDADEMLFMH